jgi:hypothetical protein
MEFSRKKLAKDLLPSLYRMRIDSVQPFALMFSPVYVLLNENQKFVSVKAPLDFFSPEEIKRLLPYTYFYVPDFVVSVVPFREAGLAVREILNWKPNLGTLTQGSFADDFELDPPSYEATDAVLKVLGPLWWLYPSQGSAIEPFLAAVFVNELCDLLPHAKLLQARERDAVRFELALLRSSWVVFLALHLGYCDLNFLNDLRLQVFDSILVGKVPEGLSQEISELIMLSELSLPTSRERLLQASFFGDRSEKISQKLVSRISRIRENFISKGEHPPSIYGEKGFIDG